MLDRLPRRLLLDFAALMACVFAISPLLWGLSTSLKPLAQIFLYPPRILPWPVSLENFVKVWTESYFPIYFRNSLLVNAVSVVVSLTLAVHAAYGLARFSFRGKTALLLALLATSMIPGIAILVPLYNLSVQTGLYNSFTGLIIVYSAWNIPMLVWLLKGFFETIPIELEEAAMVDGCSRTHAFYLVVLPLVAPGLLAGAIMTMMFVWNDFLIGFTLTISESRRLLPVGLFAYISNVGIDWGQLTAASMIALLPMVFAFLVMQKWLVQGLTAGAVKG
jgi:ABC-type glycerol-3-phosphate transport system permease component